MELVLRVSTCDFCEVVLQIRICISLNYKIVFNFLSYKITISTLNLNCTLSLDLNSGYSDINFCAF